MKANNTLAVTRLGEDIVNRLEALDQELVSLGSGNVRYGISWSYIEDGWHFSLEEESDEVTCDVESSTFGTFPCFRTLLDSVDVEDFISRVEAFITFISKNGEELSRIRESFVEALRDIFRDRPDLDKVDVHLIRDSFEIMGVSAVRDASGALSDVLIHFYEDGFTCSVTPSSSGTLDTQTLSVVLDLVCRELGITMADDLTMAGVSDDLINDEGCDILYR